MKGPSSNKENTLLPAMTKEQLTTLFNKGLEHVKQSFGILTDREVNVRHEITVESGMSARLPGIDDAAPQHLFVSEIKGNLPGSSYLVLPQDQMHALLPEGVMTEKDETPAIEFLMELDNILTASVITVLANELDIFSYGDPPRHYEVAGRSVRSWIEQAIYEQKQAFPGRHKVTVSLSLESAGEPSFSILFVWSLFGNFVSTSIDANVHAHLHS